MARAIGIEGIVLGIFAMLLSAAPARAQSIRGTMGPTSQAEVRISVRVMPRFKLKTDSGAYRAVKTDIPAFTLVSNAPTLRYALVTQPASAAPPTGNRRLLVLIVPD